MATITVDLPGQFFAKSVRCADVIEGKTATLSCEGSEQVITQIQFASFGIPTGYCGEYEYGKCHTRTTRMYVEVCNGIENH